MAGIDRRLPAQFDTLGLHTQRPWSVPALRLLYGNPRTFTALESAWCAHVPQARAGMARLVELGYALRQPAVIADTLTGAPAARPSRVVPRYVATKAGRRLAAAAAEDAAVIVDRYPQTAPGHAVAVGQLLAMFALRRPKDKIGLSLSGAAHRSVLGRATVRWWVRRWVRTGLLRTLPFKVADVRAVVPGHVRPTASGARRLRDLFDAFDQWEQLRAELGVDRFRQLDDISALRVSEVGTTDYDHDVAAQSVFASLLASPRLVVADPWQAERMVRLPAVSATRPWTFSGQGAASVSYQPDVIYRERHGGQTVTAMLEFERSATRIEAWRHIEKFLGYADVFNTPAVLRFVVDNRNREATYVELVEAFADYLSRMPDRAASVPTMVAVSSADRLASAEDPLDHRWWYRLRWPAHPDARPRVHRLSDSPAREYFAA